MIDTVAIRVVGGGPDDLVMVPAQLVDLNLFRLLDFAKPVDCRLEFGPGDLVTTIPLPDENGREVLVAHGLFIK